MNVNRFFFFRLIFVTLGISTLCLTGCVDPKTLPGAGEIVEAQTERVTRETQEAIKKSPELQELDNLCSKEIHKPDGFVLLTMDKSVRERTFLGYGYHSEADYEAVKSFYIDYFRQHGWILTDQYNGGWGPRLLEFRKDNYLVRVYDLGRSDRVNYSLHCEKLRKTP